MVIITGTLHIAIAVAAIVVIVGRGIRSILIGCAVIIDGNTGQHPAIEGNSRFRFLPNEAVFEKRGFENAFFRQVSPK